MGTQSIEDLITDTNDLLTRIDTYLRTIGISVPLTVDVSDRPARQLGVISGAVTTDGLKASDLNIQAVTKDLQVDVLSMPAITGAVTTDALKASDLHIVTNKDLVITDFKTEVARGTETNRSSWSKIGFNPALVATTEADIWSAAGSYVFPSVATAMDVISGSANDDGTPTIHTGTSTGGTTTTLVDTGANFLGGTAAVVGDCLILDKSMNGGRTPEWGYITAVAAQTLTVANGFSSGGTGSGRVYEVIRKANSTGAQAVKIEYLDTNYAEKSEIVIINGLGAIALVNVDTFRINSFRVIATGSGNKAAGNLSLRTSGGGTTYSYITGGFTRARNSAYTVPTGKTLFVTSWTAGYGYTHNSTHYCRIYTRANIEPSTGFQTGSIFYPFTEVVMSNSTIHREFEIPTKLPAKTDIKVSAVADYAGIVTSALRGWLVSA